MICTTSRMVSASTARRWLPSSSFSIARCRSKSSTSSAKTAASTLALKTLEEVREAAPESLLEYAKNSLLGQTHHKGAAAASQAVYANLREVVAEAEELAELATEEKEEGGDSELRSVAEKELREVVLPRARRLGKELADLLTPADADSTFDGDDATLEVRAGAGGQEAALFAQEIFNVYCSYAEHLGFDVEVVKYDTVSPTGAKGSSKLLSDTGIQEAAAAIRGRGVFRALKYECGVHRVQRVPVTGTKNDRLQTSTCSVAVVPTPDDDALSIPKSDLRFDFMRSTGPGGQNVNKLDTACRVTHLPTGVTAHCEEERSQQRNRATALEKLRRTLYQQKFEEEMRRTAQARKTQVGNMDRNEKIRTYNYSRNSVTDHRAAGLTRTVPSLHQFFQGGSAGAGTTSTQGFGIIRDFADALSTKMRRERLEEVLRESDK